MGFCSDDCTPKRRIFPTENSECGDEREIFDSIASEQALLGGTNVLYYVINRAKHRHPLYKEPSVGGDWSFEGPYELAATIDFPQPDNTTVEATDSGKRKVQEAVVWISRKEFENRGCPYPQEGSVLEFWSQKPFGTDRQKAQWDIVKADPDGNIYTSETFVMYKLEVKKRSEFYAFRKTEGDTEI